MGNKLPVKHRTFCCTEIVPQS